MFRLRPKAVTQQLGLLSGCRQRARIWLLLLLIAQLTSLTFVRAQAGESPLVWNSSEEECSVQAGQATAVFKFHFRNVSARDALILAVKPSCGCTVATLPQKPWIIHRQDEGDLTAVVNLTDKSGILNKTLTVEGPGYSKVLVLKVRMPDARISEGRMANLRLASTNRQAVFRGPCADCHLEPLRGFSGIQLYQRACEICHQPDSRHRASMVPDLARISDRTPEYWRHWITEGREASLMPAFGSAQGGPLSPEQIESLVDLLIESR